MLLTLFLNKSFISSTVTFLFNSNVKSITEPVIVGTLKALPDSFPFNEGITNPIAVAAPVDYGTILAAHARPRLAFIPFLCAISSVA